MKALYKKPQWLLQCYSIFAGSFMEGILDNSKILILPEAREYYNMSYGLLGVLQSLLLVALVLGSSFSSYMLEHHGYKKTFVCAYVVPAVGLWMALAFDQMWVFFIAQIIIGVGTGTVDNIYGSFSTIFYTENKGFWLTFYGCFYGLGGFVAVPMTTWIQNLLPSMSFHGPNIGFLVMHAMCSLPLIFTHFQTAEEILADAGEESLLTQEEKKIALQDRETDVAVTLPEVPVLTPLDCLKQPRMWFLGWIMCCCLLVERAGLTWGGVYIKEHLHMDINKEGALFSSVFLILYTVARLTNGFILNKLGAYKTLYLFLTLASAVLLTGLLFENMTGIYILMLNGFFVSIYFPAVLLMLTRIYGPNSDTATSVFIPVEASFVSVCQLVLGYVDDAIGPAWSYRATLLFSILSIIMLLLGQFWVFKDMSVDHGKVEKPAGSLLQ